MNPEKPKRRSTDALEKGTLWHTRILQPDIFPQKYMKAHNIAELSADGYSILNTVTEIKLWLDGNHVPYKKSMDKEELEIACEMWLGPVKTKPYCVQRRASEIKDDHPDKTIIYSDEIWNNLLFAEKEMLAHPEFREVFTNNGASEVSLFWIDPETGLPCKCRIDRLGIDAIYDYKTISLRRGKRMYDQCLYAIKQEKYDLQAANYTLGLVYTIQSILNGTGAVYGDHDPKFLEAMMRTPEKPFKFVFQQSDRPCAVRGVIIRRSGQDRFNAFGAGMKYIEDGMRLYQEYMSKFETDPWRDCEGFVNLGDTDIFYT
jgi:hypothetical protein